MASCGHHKAVVSFSELRPAHLQDFGKLRNIRLSHLKGNPLNRKELADKIDIATYALAVQRMTVYLSSCCMMPSKGKHHLRNSMLSSRWAYSALTSEYSRAVAGG